MLGSLPKCSAALFTMVETVEGVELLGGATVVEAMVVGLRVVLVVLTTISATCFTTSFTKLLSPTVILRTGLAITVVWSVVLTTEEMTGAVELSSTPSKMEDRS